MPPFRTVYVAAILLALPLSACGKGDREADLNALDAQLTGNAVDPGLQEALGGKIKIDPKYADQSAQAASAMAPKLNGDAAKAYAQSVKLAGGKLLATPAIADGPGEEAPPCSRPWRKIRTSRAATSFAASSWCTACNGRVGCRIPSASIPARS